MAGKMLVIAVNLVKFFLKTTILLIKKHQQWPVSDFNHSCKDRVNYRYISTDLSGQITSTQNDGQDSDSSQWIQILDQAVDIVPTPI